MGYGSFNLIKKKRKIILDILLFVIWFKMGDCEESKDDRIGVNYCDKNLKSSWYDIFFIMLSKMLILWRIVRKWFVENLKGGF